MTNDRSAEASLRMGWASEDITPTERMPIAGLFHARLSEGVRDSITVTAWALESEEEHVLFVSCDLIHISNDLREAVRSRLRTVEADLDPENVILHATHSHTSPFVAACVPIMACFSGVAGAVGPADMPTADYFHFVVERVMRAVQRAWRSRAPGGIAYGLGEAVVGRNRRWVSADGQAIMYSSTAQEKQRMLAGTPGAVGDVYRLDDSPSAAESFRHIEGYEDAAVQVIATYSEQGELTGLVVNVACPAQESEEEFRISADWWHETREELRRRFGEGLPILPQCSAAGDQSPHLIYGSEAHRRMLALKGRTMRQEIASRIADCVEQVISCIGQSVEWRPLLKHYKETMLLEANQVSAEELQEASTAADRWRAQYERELRRLEEDPELRRQPRWYVDLTYAHGQMRRYRRILERSARTDYPVEVHGVRLGDIEFVTQPFECYLDSGIQLKLRSPAIQTFLVQLAGDGKYLPSLRSVEGGGYGSTQASNPVGPKGGQQLIEQAVRGLRQLFDSKASEKKGVLQ